MNSRRARRFRHALLVLPLLVWLAGADVRAGMSAHAGWMLEQGTAEPSYAVVKPTSTDLNIDSIALVCERVGGHRLLQLQIYLSDDGPLRPTYAHARPLRADPSATASIDGQAFSVALLFADEYAVLADDQEGAFPVLSDRLVAAMQTGNRMVIRFDLLEERPGQSRSFDSEAVIDFNIAGGREAVAAMRRCARPAKDPRVTEPLVEH
jgi:hypothetical protein